MSLRSLCWTFTLNNYSDEEVVALRSRLSDPDIRYAVFGKETATTTGTPHLQGYISFKKRQRLKAVKQMVSDRAHVEVAKGNERQNFDYCTKQDKEFEEFGVRSERGKRSDLEGFKEAVKSGLRDAKRLREEHSEVMARYSSFCTLYVQDHTPLPELEQHPLRVWQSTLFDLLGSKPDKRKIHFLVDYKGNTGKTWFAKYYMRTHDDVIILEPGKKSDLAFMIPSGIRVVFINCTRQRTEYLSYDFLENLKDGIIQSPKFVSHVKHIEVPHVVVLMNQDPDPNLLSEDRYDIINLE